MQWYIFLKAFRVEAESGVFVMLERLLERGFHNNRYIGSGAWRDGVQADSMDREQNMLLLDYDRLSRLFVFLDKKQCSPGSATA